jgi:hypothetical protein
MVVVAWLYVPPLVDMVDMIDCFGLVVGRSGHMVWWSGGRTSNAGRNWSRMHPARSCRELVASFIRAQPDSEWFARLSRVHPNRGYIMPADVVDAEPQSGSMSSPARVRSPGTQLKAPATELYMHNRVHAALSLSVKLPVPCTRRCSRSPPYICNPVHTQQMSAPLRPTPPLLPRGEGAGDT